MTLKSLIVNQFTGAKVYTSNGKKMARNRMGGRKGGKEGKMKGGRKEREDRREERWEERREWGEKKFKLEVRYLRV